MTTILICTCVGFVVGYAACGYLIANDESVIKVADDEMIVKRPADGLILVAVSPTVARRIVMQSDKEFRKNSQEARDLYSE